jgi:uncharacterized protein YjbI with pentapeptide repeats
VQEREVRLTAQDILVSHLAPGADTDRPLATFWADIDLNLSGAVVFDFALTHCRVRNARFTDTSFHGDATFCDTTFSGDTRFDATLHSEAIFDRATFGKSARFNGTTFSDDAKFNAVTFAKDAIFDQVTFSNAAWFVQASFHGAVSLCDVTYSSDLSKILDRATKFPISMNYSRPGETPTVRM